MTDLSLILPDFSSASYTHILPSLERHLFTVSDLLSSDSIDIARRAQVPHNDLRRLIDRLLKELQQQLSLAVTPTNDRGAEHNSSSHQTVLGASIKKTPSLKSSGDELLGKWELISLLDETLDKALNGGIPRGCITEITGESGVGKTQFLCTLLLSAQLAKAGQQPRPTLYISTEAPLPTSRLSQMLRLHPLLSESTVNGPRRPSLGRVFSVQIPDLESQDHIFTYQLPLIIDRQDIGLVVIDSIAANYRAEADNVSFNQPALLANRSASLARVGAQLRNLAFRHCCAIVVANQVADRIGTDVLLHQSPTHNLRNSQPVESSPIPSGQSDGLAPEEDGQPLDEFLGLNHQQRFFTGWGDGRYATGRNMKTPSLGLMWSNQLACRIALTRESVFVKQTTSETPGRLPAVKHSEQERETPESAEWTPRGWKRHMRVVFSSWGPSVSEGANGIEFQIWSGGVRSAEVSGQQQPDNGSTAQSQADCSDKA